MFLFHYVEQICDGQLYLYIFLIFNLIIFMVANVLYFKLIALHEVEYIFE